MSEENLRNFTKLKYAQKKTLTYSALGKKKIENGEKVGKLLVSRIKPKINSTKTIPVTLAEGQQELVNKPITAQENLIVYLCYRRSRL